MRVGWELKSWSEVLEIRNGRSQKDVIDPNGDYPIYGSGGVMGNASDYICEEGTTIIGRKGSINKPLFIESKFWNVDTAFGLSALNGLDRKFLYYFCLGYDFSKRDKGTTLPSLTKKDLLTIEMPIPPFQEQKQIVAILDKTFAAIDQARANVERNLQNAKELFQSKLNELFSQKGEGWAIKRIDEICENLDSKRIPITQNKRIKGNIPYYGASGIVDYVSEYIFNEDLLLVSEDGANLLARTYPIAFSVSGKTWVNNHAHVLRFQNIESQRFIEYFLNSIKLDDYVSGMAQPKLNQKMLNSISVPFPDLNLQIDVVSTLNKMSSELKLLEANYKAQIVGMSELKKSILQKAFNGELNTTIA